MSKEEAKLRAENEALKAQLAEQSRLVQDTRAEADKLRADMEALRVEAAVAVREASRAAHHTDRPTVPAVALVPLHDADGKPTHYWEAREYDVPTTGGRSVVPKGDVLRHPEAKLLAAAHLREVTTRQGREAGW